MNTKDVCPDGVEDCILCEKFPSTQLTKEQQEEIKRMREYITNIFDHDVSLGPAPKK